MLFNRELIIPFSSKFRVELHLISQDQKMHTGEITTYMLKDRLHDNQAM
jgi:hypothetical protein